MSYRSTDPATGETVARFDGLDEVGVDRALTHATEAAQQWRQTTIEERCAAALRLAGILRARRDELAGLMTLEMGKLGPEGLAEVDKCAAAIEYLAGEAPSWLADEVIDTDARKSIVAWQPLGTVLAIMPWNFPFWQVIRCAVPAMLGGNVVLLKHASNVPQCALALAQAFADAGVPEGAFQSLFIDNEQVAEMIADVRVHAVALTGSERAGRAVAAVAGANLKRCVLELGGSDPFVVLDDAPLEAAVKAAVKSRFQNAGQSCIAAKRFIVMDDIHDAFVEAFRDALSELEFGKTLAPLARVDLRDELHKQVTKSVDSGAECLVGGAIPDRKGAWYPATLLTGVRTGMPAADEELFGPVAAVMRATDEAAAFTAANATRYGLGASVWTGDAARGERFARAVASGMAFVNDMVRSDARLPFGGVKASGYGRELSRLGIREFLNAKTVWVA
jgi:succinate-semialdehyde dehydrogenase / glutarate-semialdehyde dehydrogenase